MRQSLPAASPGSNLGNTRDGFRTEEGLRNETLPPPDNRKPQKQKMPLAEPAGNAEKNQQRITNTYLFTTESTEVTEVSRSGKLGFESTTH
jgi:hypothetical protein